MPSGCTVVPQFGIRHRGVVETPGAGLVTSNRDLFG
jgi:hypothetical protein